MGALPYFTERAGYDGPIYMTVCIVFTPLFIPLSVFLSFTERALCLVLLAVPNTCTDPKPA